MTSDDELQAAIQQNLQEIAVQVGQPIDEAIAQQLYDEAVSLLSHLSYSPITLARLSGLLLVYRLQTVEPEEVAWVKAQVQQCSEAEEVEELIDSLSRESL